MEYYAIRLLRQQAADLLGSEYQVDILLDETLSALQPEGLAPVEDLMLVINGPKGCLTIRYAGMMTAISMPTSAKVGDTLVLDGDVQYMCCVEGFLMPSAALFNNLDDYWCKSVNDVLACEVKFSQVA